MAPLIAETGGARKRRQELDAREGIQEASGALTLSLLMNTPASSAESLPCWVMMRWMALRTSAAMVTSPQT